MFIAYDEETVYTYVEHFDHVEGLCLAPTQFAFAHNTADAKKTNKQKKKTPCAISGSHPVQPTLRRISTCVMPLCTFFFLSFLGLLALLALLAWLALLALLALLAFALFRSALRVCRVDQAAVRADPDPPGPRRCDMPHTERQGAVAGACVTLS